MRAGLKAEAERVVKAEGTTLNRSIDAAVAEKPLALRTAEYFRKRAARADLGEAFAPLESFADPDAPLREGNELEEPAGTARGRVADTGRPA